VLLFLLSFFCVHCLNSPMLSLHSGLAVIVGHAELIDDCEHGLLRHAGHVLLVDKVAAAAINKVIEKKTIKNW